MCWPRFTFLKDRSFVAGGMEFDLYFVLLDFCSNNFVIEVGLDLL